MSLTKSEVFNLFEEPTKKIDKKARASLDKIQGPLKQRWCLELVYRNKKHPSVIEQIREKSKKLDRHSSFKDNLSKALTVYDAMQSLINRPQNAYTFLNTAQTSLDCFHQLTELEGKELEIAANYIHRLNEDLKAKVQEKFTSTRHSIGYMHPILDAINKIEKPQKNRDCCPFTAFISLGASFFPSCDDSRNSNTADKTAFAFH